MNCSDVRRLLHGYIDDELDIVTSTDIETHLRGCDPCRKIVEQQRSFLSVVRNAGLYNALPDGLSSRVVGSVRYQEPSYKARVPALWRSVAIAALILLGIAVGANFMNRQKSAGEELLADQIYQSHIRSLQVDHVTDVVSSDQHTVKPWFNGKVDFSPMVRDLHDSGFVLIGGRLDFIRNQPVAAIVYGRRLHAINLFIWPRQREYSGMAATENRNGYTMLSWTADGMDYCAVSDLNPDELHHFVNLFNGSA